MIDPNLDPYTTDVPDLVKLAQAQAVELQGLKQDSSEIRDFVNSARTRERQQWEAQAHQARAEEIYSACDEEFGTQYRKEAIKLSNEWVGNGDEPAPTTQVQGLKLMRKAYAKAVEKHRKSQPAERSVHLTPSNIANSDEFKPGTLEEVAKDMARKMKTGKWDRKAFTAKGLG